MFHGMVTMNWPETKRVRNSLDECNRRMGAINHRLCSAVDPCWNFTEKWPLEGSGGLRLPDRVALGVDRDRFIPGPYRVADVLQKNPVTGAPKYYFLKN